MHKLVVAHIQGLEFGQKGNGVGYLVNGIVGYVEHPQVLQVAQFSGQACHLIVGATHHHMNIVITHTLDKQTLTG